MKINLSEEIKLYLDKKEETDDILELINKSKENRLLDEIDKANDEIERLKLDIRILKDREKKIIKIIIEILDSIEWTLRIVKTLSNKTLNITIENTWKKIRNKLMTIGLIQIFEKDCVFNEVIHKCIDIVEDESKESGQVTEIIKSGYLYKGEIIRTAEVIVVSN